MDAVQPVLLSPAETAEAAECLCDCLKSVKEALQARSCETSLTSSSL